MKKFYLSILTLLLIFGCAAKHTQPKGIAYDFWLAQKNHHIDEAAKLTLKQNKNDTKLHKKIKIEDIHFDNATIKDNQATIPTTLTLKDFSMLNHKEAKISFDTKMQKQDNNWKINMFETKKALYLAIGKEFAQSLSNDLGSVIQQTLGDKEQIQGIFKQLIKGIQKATKESDKIN